MRRRSMCSLRSLQFQFFLWAVPPVFENQPQTASLIVVNGVEDILARPGGGRRPGDHKPFLAA